MRVISFDVGIKNMAYCILDVNQQSANMIDWNVLNLMDEQQTNICSQCVKPAKFKKDDVYFCICHAKKSKHVIPTKTCSISYIQKLKKDDLVIFAHNHFIHMNKENTPISQMNKCDMLREVTEQMRTKLLEPVHDDKLRSYDTTLIAVGKNMKRLLDKINNIELITHVIIENQISPIATRMKTIQGMLAQYFIMKCGENICIEFLSSSNKLKGMIVENEIVEKGSGSGSKYKQNKKNGIVVCSLLLNSNEQFNDWKWTMNVPKKDDYADAFLQAVFYLKKNGLIQCSPNGEHPHKIIVCEHDEEVLRLI